MFYFYSISRNEVQCLLLLFKCVSSSPFISEEQSIKTAQPIISWKIVLDDILFIVTHRMEDWEASLWTEVDLAVFTIRIDISTCKMNKTGVSFLGEHNDVCQITFQSILFNIHRQMPSGSPLGNAMKESFLIIRILQKNWNKLCHRKRRRNITKMWWYYLWVQNTVIVNSAFKLLHHWEHLIHEDLFGMAIFEVGVHRLVVNARISYWPIKYKRENWANLPIIWSEMPVDRFSLLITVRYAICELKKLCCC